VQCRLEVLVGTLLILLTACQSSGILQGRSHERAFRERYLQRSFYTAMFIQPYRYNEDYLVDLAGKMSEAEADVPRAAVFVPVGTPITVVGLDERHILTRIDGHARLFRLLVDTKHGTIDAVAQELALVLAKEPPLLLVRSEMRPFIERQEVVRGMTRREVAMSWGLPDKMTSIPGGTGTLEEWIYFARRLHVFLENGVVTNWQQH